MSVVVFRDFECPMCAHFATQTYPEFRDRYPGKVALTYRYWPLSQRHFAYPAAGAAECAGGQGRFWEFHDQLCAEQARVGVIVVSATAAAWVPAGRATRVSPGDVLAAE